MRPGTFAELAGEHGEQPSNPGGFSSFEDFVSMYQVAARLVREGPRENLLRLVREVVEDAAADGAVWIEPQVNPLTYEDDPGAALDLLDAVIDEGRRTAARLGIGFGVLVYARRNADPSEAVRAARLAARRADNGVVSFGLAGDEARYAPEPFAQAFTIARDAGLIPAPHAGELVGPDSVRAVLDVLGARRIAHGIRAVEDPDLVARLAAEGVVLDVCPTSNVALGVVESLSVHPPAAAASRCPVHPQRRRPPSVRPRPAGRVRNSPYDLRPHRLSTRRDSPYVGRILRRPARNRGGDGHPHRRLAAHPRPSNGTPPQGDWRVGQGVVNTRGEPIIVEQQPERFEQPRPARPLMQLLVLLP